MTAINPRIIVALDFDNLADVIRCIEQLDSSLCRVKVGKELFTRLGPAVIEELTRRGFDIFLDLKFHDIPNTTAQAVKSAAELGVWMVNVHAGGGRRMMEAAHNALEKTSGKKPYLIAVTVLTSLEQQDLQEVGINVPVVDQVKRLAQLSFECALDGVVCSAQEASLLRQEYPKFVLVTPGIRPHGSSQGDQKRIVTPSDALKMGSDYLVIGRPITQSDNPAAALTQIHNDIFSIVSP